MPTLVPARIVAQPKTRALTDGEISNLRSQFPYKDFTIDKDEFAMAYDSVVCRVNSDGMAHDLTAWALDAGGEFKRRVVGSGGKAISVLKDPYWERRLQYEGSATIRGIRRAALIAAVPLWATAYLWHQLPPQLLFGALGAGAVAVMFMVGDGRQLRLRSDGGVEGDLLFRKSDVGPEPLRQKGGNAFGPEVGTVPDDGPEVDEYRPNNGFADSDRLIAQAEAGDIQAQSLLGYNLFFGLDGFPCDKNRAREWLRKVEAYHLELADDDLEALFMLGLLRVDYFDATEGRRCIEQAAAQGHEDAAQWLSEHPAPDDGPPVEEYRPNA